ncbi:hypothetical protein MMC22_008322 [Lobaria immixta]|nr:hypothetical protein [Lobaria immixta]
MSTGDAPQSPLTTATSQITGKRKRVGSTDETGNAEDDQDDGHDPRKQNHNLHDFLVDIVEILRRQDTTPSILDYQIASVAGDGETHDAKRTKLSEPAAKPTIASRVESRVYTSIEEAAADIEAVVSKVIHELQQKAPTVTEQRLSAHTREIRAEIALASAFKKRFDNLILREMIQRPQTFSPTERNDESASEKVSADGRSTKIPVLGGSNDAGARAVLTLYGSAPQPKQLFSSLQQPLGMKSKLLKSKGVKDLTADVSDDSSSTTILAPSRDLIREPALPNGISVTKVIPVHSTNSSDGKQEQTPTLGELFPPPPTLQPLNHPKQSRHTATRSSSVNWYNPSEPVTSSRPNRRDCYSMQPLTTGQWLTYNIAPSSTQMSSPEAKRKQRDRALSFGEPQSTVSQEVVIAHSQAKEDALFRSVYSSFAPDRDNAGALISDHTKNRLWWKRVGENRYNDFKEANPPSPAEEDVVEVNGTSKHVNSADDDEFKGLLDDWTPEELPPELKPTPAVVLEAPETTEEVDEILQGISELLETLNSYQRNRNLSLANNARTITNSLSTSGSPTSPSSAEFDVFTMLQSQLALMVSTLPPYALAKLDGDQLGVLNISTKIRIQDKQYTGTMEEDEVLAKAKQATTTPAASYSSRNANANLSVPARSSSYVHAPTTPSQPVQRPSYATQPRPANTASSYLPNQQYSSRPASSNHYFSGTSHPSYSSQRPTATTSERYVYSASQQYSQRAAPPSQNQQSNGYRSYPAQNGQSYSQQYSTPQQGASSTSGPPPGVHTQRPSQPGYQQRAMNAQSYSSGSASARDASSPKPSSTFSPQHQRTSYTGQGQIPTQQRPQMYHQHSAQYAPQIPVPRQVNGAGAGATLNSSQHTYMTAEEQSALMNRQKAQLAEQQSSAVRQGSGTPQPANGHYSGPQNGTPAVQSNGVAVGQGQ